MDKLFHKSVKGSSHNSSGKPCQDYSLAENTDNYSIAIVSDGHGSDTYVRSHIGSEIAVKVAKKRTIEFLEQLYKNPVFKEVNIQVGPKPSSDKAKKLVHVKTGKIPDELAQQIQYFEAIENNVQVDNNIRAFFEQIHHEWLHEIREHASKNPLNDEEKHKLGKEKITKAYGCTLICAITTNDFYFAYQIGDGRCYFSDAKNEWTQPIPWDCKCFLNVTTSLCLDNNPANEFRYILNTKKQKPQVICIGSDGIDGSYDIEKEIELDYYAIIDEYITALSDNTIDFEKDLEDFLSQKSLTCSHDDMSVSCIINMDSVTSWLKLNKIKKEVYIEEIEGKKKKKEISRIESILANLEKRRSDLEKQISKNEGFIKKEDSFIEEDLKAIQELNNDIESRGEKKSVIKDEISKFNEELNKVSKRTYDLNEQLKAANENYEKWYSDTTSKVIALKNDRQRILNLLESNADNATSSSEKKWNLFLQNADSIILAKFDSTDKCYTFHASSVSICRVDEKEDERENEREENQKIMTTSLFLSLKQQLSAAIGENDYTYKASENKYIYISFLKDDNEIGTIFMSLDFESVFKKIFKDIWKDC